MLSALRIKIFRVSGDSMKPTVRHGDFVLAEKYKGEPPDGCVVVIKHHCLGNLIKRIKMIPGTSNFIASGDNKLSDESSTMNVIEKHEVLFRAVWRISPTGIQRLNINPDAPTAKFL